MSWTIDELAQWADRIEEKARALGLDPYPPIFSVVSEQTMIEDLALAAMPVRYPHWSFGKAASLAELRRHYFGFGAAEIVANSNPAEIRLLATNSLPLQILTMAHALAHSHFMRHNRAFRYTNPADAFAMMRRHRERIQQLSRDPAVGAEAVEEILNAAHAVRFIRSFPSSEKRPSLLRTIARFSPSLPDWAREVLLIVDEETEYFVPQIETKILNEGWASVWHLKIVNALSDLPSEVRSAARIAHAKTVLRFPDAAQGELFNPYLVGFRLFEDIDRRWDRMARGSLKPNEHWDGMSGEEKIFSVARHETDATALRRYLTVDLARRLALFRYGPMPRPAGQQPSSLVILDTVESDESFDAVRAAFLRNVGLNAFPTIDVVDTNYGRNMLYLRHRWDGRELDEQETKLTMRLLRSCWAPGVILETRKASPARRLWYILRTNDAQVSESL